MRLTNNKLNHSSTILKVSPAPLIKQVVLVPFNRPSHEHQRIKNMVRHLGDFFAVYHLLDSSSISGPGYLSIPSAVNLLNNPDIATEAERFIRSFHPTSIYLIKGMKRSTSSEEHQSSRKNHRLPSSMSTSFNKDGSIHINVKYD